MVRVWIVYNPYLFADVLEQLLRSSDSVSIVDHPFQNVDVIVLPLNEIGLPETDLLPYPLPPAKLIAISPRGDQAQLRLPGDTGWRELAPFALADLLAEISAGKQRARPLAPKPAQGRQPAAPAAPSLADWLATLLPRPRRVNPWLATLVASLAALYYFSLGTLAAAEASMPGDPLYDLKRMSEDAQLALASPSQDSELNVIFAERRLAEITELAEQGIVVPEVIEDMAESTGAAVAATVPEPAEPELIAAIADLTSRQAQVLRAVQTAVPDPEAQRAVELALSVSSIGHEQAVAALGQPPSTEAAVASVPSSPTPGAPLPASTPTPTRTAAAPTATSLGLPWPTATPMRQLPPTKTPTPSEVPTESATDIPLPTDIPPTTSPSQTPTSVSTLLPPGRTPTPTSTATPTDTPVPTKTLVPTATNTPVPTATDTPVPTKTPTDTATPTNTPTDTPTPTDTATPTATPTDTATPTHTPTPTPSATATETATETPSPEPSSTSNPSSTVAPAFTAPPDEPTGTPVPELME